MTLAVYRERTRQTLADADSMIWEDDDIDEAIRQAAELYSRQQPAALNTTHTCTAGREQDISAIEGLINVVTVWLPYTAADPEFPPNRQAFQYWPESKTLFLLEYEPNAGEIARIFYSAAHTITDLDSAASTTVPAENAGIIAIGAAALAASSRAVDRAQKRNEIDVMVAQNIRAWGQAQYSRFAAQLKAVTTARTANHTGAAAIPRLDKYVKDWS